MKMFLSHQYCTEKCSLSDIISYHREIQNFQNKQEEFSEIFAGSVNFKLGNGRLSLIKENGGTFADADAFSLSMRRALFQDETEHRISEVRSHVAALGSAGLVSEYHHIDNILILMADAGYGPQNADVDTFMTDELLPAVTGSNDFVLLNNFAAAVAVGKTNGGFLAATETAILAAVESILIDGLLQGGTENQVTQHRMAALLLGEAYPTATMFVGTDAEMTGAKMAAEAKEFFRKLGAALYKYSWSEHASQNYLGLNFSAISLIEEYSTDAEARLIARAILDYSYAELAVIGLDNLTPPMQRAKGPIERVVRATASPYEENTPWMSWLHFGAETDFFDGSGNLDPKIVGDRWFDFKHQKHAQISTLSGYRPHPLIRWVGAREHGETYRVRQRVANYYALRQSDNPGVTPQVLENSVYVRATGANRLVAGFSEAREVYTSDDYLVGVSIPRAKADANNSQVIDPTRDAYGMVYRTAGHARSIRIAHPFIYWDKEPRDENGQDVGWTWQDYDWAGYSPFGVHAMRDNLLLSAYDLTLDDPYTGGTFTSRVENRSVDSVHQAVYVYVPSELMLDSVEGDRRFYIDNDVYLLVVPFGGTVTTETDTRHVGVADRLKVAGSKVGAFMLFGSATEHGDLAGFKAWAEDATFDASGFAAMGAVSYSHADGASLSVTHPGVPNVDSDGYATEPPAIVRDSAALVFDDAWPELESPFVNRANSVLTVEGRGETLEIDWSGSLPVYSENKIVLK